MTAVASSIVNQFKESANPFVRLVWQHTADDGHAGVTHFQSEQVRDAVFQSDYACDWVYKALIKQLEHPRSSAITIYKTLYIIRNLMLDGPATFTAKMPTQLGKLIQIAQTQDTLRNTVEDENKKLAQAIHQAVTGNSSALLRTSGADTQASQPVEGAGKQTSYKSDFQVAQEREAKAFRKRKEEERRSADVVVNDKVFDTFDATLGPVKLVQSAVTSAKKKFAPEEIASFVDAALSQEKVSDVAQALDGVLKDLRNSLAVRFKILTLIDAIVETNNPEVMLYFNKHVLGLQRHTQLEASDNPSKSQQTVHLAVKVLQIVSNPANVVAATAPSAGSTASGGGARPRGQSTFGVAPGMAVIGGVGGSSSSFAGANNVSSRQVAPSAATQPFAAPAPTTTSFAPMSYGASSAINPVFADLDDMFATMQVKGTPVPAAPAPPQPPVNVGGFGTGLSHPPSWGAAPAPPQPASWGAPPSQSGWGASAPTAPASMSWGGAPQQPTAAPPAQAPPPAGGPSMADMMAQMQRNMQMMQAMMMGASMGAVDTAATAPSAPPPVMSAHPAATQPVMAPPPASAWVLPPQPPVLAPPPAASSSELQRSSSAPSTAEPTVAGGSRSASTSIEPSSAAPNRAAPAPEALEALRQIQQQMQATQAILAQQQAMFMQLQTQILGGGGSAQ